MKFDLVSDVHIEMWHDKPDWGDVCDNRILVVAGDTSNSIVRSANALNEAAHFYDHVLVVDGNHEFYDTGRMNVEEAMEAFRAELFHGKNGNKITYLPNSACCIEGTMFVGFNGWYDFKMADGFDREAQHNAWKMGSNDSRFIRFKNYPDKMAADQAHKLAFVVRNGGGNPAIKEIVVVTHTSPLLRGLRTTHDPFWNMMNGAYGNTEMKQVLDADVAHKIKVWCFGHTHYNNDFVQDGVRFLSAPRGYQGEHQLDWRGPLSVDTEENLHE